MENVSKAMLIAGGMLITILVLSLVAFGWNQLSKYQNSRQQSTKLQQLYEYNKEFESYNKKVIHGYELVSLANLANDTNTRYAEEDGFSKLYVYVKLLNKDGRLPGPGVGKPETNNGYNLLNYIKNTFNSNTITSDEKKEFKDMYFQCINVDYNSNTARVSNLYYEEIRKSN